MSNPRALTLNIEAVSDEHLRKLLELALFDLSKINESSRSVEEGDSLLLSMDGDMGGYKLEYKLGTHALIEQHQKLLDRGYQRVETTELRTENYSLYEHVSEPALRLYLTSAQITNHDPIEHEENFLRF